MADRRDVTLAQVNLRLAATDDAVGRLALPREPNAWRDGEPEAVWLGPDEWLVVGPVGSQHAIVAELEAALSGTHRSVVDVSANRSAFDLIGDDRYDLLSCGCSLDLGARAWGSGRCAQTLFARVPVLLQERGEVTRVFVRPSYLGYLTAWLDDVSV